MNRLYYISATVILLFFMSHSHLHSLSLSHLLTRLYRFTYFLNYTSKLWFWRILFFFFALLLKYFKCVLATSNTIRLSLENDILMFYRKRDNSFFNIIFEKGKEWRIYIYIYSLSFTRTSISFESLLILSQSDKILVIHLRWDICICKLIIILTIRRDILLSKDCINYEYIL